MKQQLGAVVLISSVLLAGLAFSQNPPAKDPFDKRVEKLEKDLGEARAKLDAVTAESTETKARLAATVKYLEQQSKAAAAMAQVLDDAEKAGFTYGINPDSRTMLLRGWRDQIAASQKGLPATAAPATPTKTGAQR